MSTLGFGLLAGRSPIRQWVVIDLVVAVSELTEVAILTIFNATTRACVLLATGNGPVGELSVAEQRPSKLANRMGMPTRVESLASVLALRVFTDLDSRICRLGLREERGTRLHVESFHQVV